MGYFPCNGNSANATCQWDPFCWGVNTASKTRNSKRNKKKLPNIREFEYSDLVEATNGFSADSFLGKGSHGSVYRATLDDGNLIAAVKTSKFRKPSATSLLNHRPNCTNCSKCTSPAENEIQILSGTPISDRIVNLIGHCTDSDLNKLIVVDYMPNGSLHDLLHSKPNPPAWAPRIRFALQVAEAIRNLHCSNPPVIHRDIKSSNVLIDGDWNARIGDFGLAVRDHESEFRGKSTLPAGTLGYIDPCYLAPENLSEKSDVFSFGILLLEIISRRKAIDVKYSPPSVVEWAVPLIKKGGFDGIRDRRIGTPSDLTVIERMAALAARCVRWKAERRPTMAEVVECLKHVRKRVDGWRIMWRRVKRRVGGKEKAECLNRLVKKGSRRNGKVSRVGVIEDHNDEMSEAGDYDQVVRSKSIGFEEGEMRIMQINQSGSHQVGLSVRRKEELRLKKSRSVGVSHPPRLLLGLSKAL